MVLGGRGLEKGGGRAIAGWCEPAMARPCGLTTPSSLSLAMSVSLPSWSLASAACTSSWTLSPDDMVLSVLAMSVVDLGLDVLDLGGGRGNTNSDERRSRGGRSGRSYSRAMDRLRLRAPVDTLEEGGLDQHLRGRVDGVCREMPRGVGPGPAPAMAMARDGSLIAQSASLCRSHSAEKGSNRDLCGYLGVGRNRTRGASLAISADWTVFA